MSYYLITLVLIIISFFVGGRIVATKLKKDFSVQLDNFYNELKVIDQENKDLKQQLADLKYQNGNLQKTLNYTEAKLKQD